MEDDTLSKKDYFSKDELKVLNNVVLIEGPNDSGKSILLNCIALACYGLKFGETDNKKVNEELYPKLEWLANTDHTYSNIEFDLEITNDGEDEKLKLSSKKILSSKQIDVYLNDTPITFETFKSLFNLIYDIPSNPTKRLTELLNESMSRLGDIHSTILQFDE